MAVVSIVQVVQTRGAWTEDRDSVLRQYYQQCIWIADSFGDLEWDGGEAWTYSLAVSGHEPFFNVEEVKERCWV